MAVLKRTQVQTPWIGTGKPGDPYRPLIADTAGVSWVDVTGADPSQAAPGAMFSVESDCTPQAVTAIQADNRLIVAPVADAPATPLGSDVKAAPAPVQTTGPAAPAQVA